MNSLINTTADQIKEIVENALRSLGLPSVSFAVEHPANPDNGDYAVNIALVLSKQLGQNPNEIAKNIANQIQTNLPQYISKVEIAGPGFINFYLSKKHLVKTVLEFSESTQNNGTGIFAGKKILVEHSSPNLFKSFHIGHVMNNTIGEAITRLAHASGASVTCISYPSDISPGIAKAVYIMKNDGADTLNTYSNIDEKLRYLGDCYVRGTKAFEEDDTVKDEVKKITRMLYEKTPGPELELYEMGKNINLDYFKNITKVLGSNFDAFIYESEAGEKGAQIVRENTPKVFTPSQGATIFAGEEYGLHTRVFINTEGFPTYEAKDIGLLDLKFERYNPDISLFITDHEQTEYFKVVSKAAGLVNQDWQNKTIHRTHGRMSFKGQKMSSRLGGVPLAIELINTVTDEVIEKAGDRLSSDDAQRVAIGAIKFIILKSVAGKNINFDPETSLSFEGDSGPYLQYTAVRAGSLLEKAKHINADTVVNVESLLNENSLPLERLLARYNEIILRSINEWAPHYVVNYLLELAQAFNSFYANTQVIDESNPNAAYNIALVKSAKNVLEKGLHMLAIPVPEKM